MHQRLLFLAILGIIHTRCAFANDDVQYIKSVKGGHGGGHQYNAGANFGKLFGNSTQQGGGYNMRYNLTAPVDHEVGVCYKEVPTASLVRDPSHIPAGNGSRPDLSRIRTCCPGYIRNIHNYWICDPVCSKECVNAICTAPEVCTCFPDHVKNLAGYCIATCPIGCQNGQCAGGECLCKEGYKLDSDSKFCIPNCKGNCGGIGNCTSPNTCECRSGYHTTPEGSCKPVCERCLNGDCVAPNECRCHQGYTKDQHGQCAPHCPQGCGHNGRCISPNVCDIPAYAGPVPGNPTSYYPNNQPPHQPGSQHPQQPGNQPPYQPGSQPPYQPGNQPSYQPGNQPTYQPGNQPPYQPGNQPTYQPGNQPPYQPGSQPPYQPGNQPPYQPGTQPPYFSVNYPNNQPLYPSNQHSYTPSSSPPNQAHPDQQNYPFPPSGTPQCSQPCLNGVCVEGNRCACNSGYVLDKTDPSGTRCVPNCSGGCPNGVCSAPNFCICNMGYYKDHSVKGRPSCVKRVRRSVDLNPDLQAEDKKPINVAELLVFEIPDREY